MKWPEPGTCPKIRLDQVTHNALILGMAPIGVRWEGRMRHGKIIPNKGCPAGEFSPCYARVLGCWREIECPKTKR